MAVVACAGKLAIVGPIPTHRPLPLQLMQEQAQQVLYRLWQGWDSFRDISMERNSPGHRDTIPTTGITSSPHPDTWGTCGCSNAHRRQTGADLPTVYAPWRVSPSLTT